MSDELIKQGLKWMLECVFPQSQTPPGTFYIGLCEDASVNEDAVLADLTELSGNGYARQTVTALSVTGFTSEQAGTNDWKVTTITVEFEASGGAWNGAEHCFLGTSVDDSGVLVAVAALSQERTLQDGDKLQVSMVIQLNG
jgi:hypothetical protein